MPLQLLGGMQGMGIPGPGPAMLLLAQCVAVLFGGRPQEQRPWCSDAQPNIAANHWCLDAQPDAQAA